MSTSCQTLLDKTKYSSKIQSEQLTELQNRLENVIKKKPDADVTRRVEDIQSYSEDVWKLKAQVELLERILDHDLRSSQALLSNTEASLRTQSGTLDELTELLPKISQENAEEVTKTSEAIEGCKEDVLRSGAQVVILETLIKAQEATQ